ncbi:MAG: hypothetical protein IH941_13100 [Acidobacteria bacterium]|nr:hypothetical protein [Acidobacteriota bacterium]
MKRPATILAALVIALSACTGEQASNPPSSSATTGGSDATTPSSATAPIATETPAARPSADYFGIFIWNFGTDDFPSPEVLTLEGNDFTGNERLDVWIEPNLE